MQINPGVKQKIQFVLALAIGIAGVRAAYIVYERRVSKIEQVKNQPPPLNPDYYVIPKKLYPYDLKSARQLTQQPVWVKEGYRYTYYRYDPARHHVDFAHEAGLLLPIEKLEIKDVITDVAPGAPGLRQVMAVFVKDGNTYAFPIGSAQGTDYRIYSDEMLYIQDPHDLYKHWPADVWEAIGKHEVKPGMNELQADFAIGMGIPDRSSDPAVKTVNYPNGGKPLSITYHDGRAAEINPGH
ncbi:MAG TPA: hypothetical protein VMT28_10120 [Terriglobales bacterium]|jgi:hypothetical protein|nr:hypothetical protein [Terriglobales bacterium]